MVAIPRDTRVEVIDTTLLTIMGDIEGSPRSENGEKARLATDVGLNLA